MRRVIVLVLFSVLCVHLLEAKDLVVGTRINNLLISTQKFVFKGIPLIRRNKDYVYTDPKQRIIKGIIARDLSRSDTEATVTAGGVGHTHVTLHFRTKRGADLNYLVLIFTDNR